MSAIKIENLVRDYGGGKGVFDVFLFRRGNFLMHFVAEYLLLSLYHVPDIHFIFKDSTDGGNSPHTVIFAYPRCLQIQALAVLVCCGCGYSHFG